ncbi:tRNA lysidine(34) synthetase TilS [Gimesia aquarii]|uniref:tRNA(Ile)-lysidine synthase n=1 Tax=Gimesia aquarii TaxID=2527964 RepID=A0A517WWV4_9PLAN|nr:tRNA lysidine(34) synthetase TilS [Gimesia aquarii]QDU09724.1 tRNA(Ile)-lysidine synthase [Gimesia aquarii]
MNQFVQAVKQGLLECEGRVESESLKDINASPPTSILENRILIAVSGGADSVALMQALHQLSNSSYTASLTVAHFNHGLRGNRSDTDAKWLKTECERLAIPFVYEKQELSRLQQESGEGLEELCRKVRYDFLVRMAQENQCTRIAIAHTCDDQAETVLHHIIRGTGISGLKGIPRIRHLQKGIFLIRPLLEISRGEILNYLKICSQEFRQDETNSDVKFTRNRIRHELLPFLKKELNSNVIQALNRLSHQADEVSTLIDEQAEQILTAATLDKNQEIWRLDCDVFKNTPDYIIRQCFLKIWQRMDWPRKRMGFDHWQRLLKLSRSDQKLNLPDGINAERRERLLILRRLKAPTL